MYYIDSCGALIFDFCYPQKKEKKKLLFSISKCYAFVDTN